MFFALLTLAAALSPSTVHDNIPGTATIGEVSTAAGARNVQDLNVYGQSTKLRLPAECFPVQVYGVNYGPDDVTYTFVAEENRCYFGAGPSWVIFTPPDFTFAAGHEMTFNGKAGIAGEWPKLEFPIIPTGDTLVTSGEIGEVTGYARAVYNYMIGNTNAWFSGTNYPDHTSVAVKHKFEFEPGMDLAAVPCSMSLMEIRDGKRGVVWDQRDWPAWYWSFKSRQMWDRISETNKAIIASIPRKAWSSYTARGLDNPDPTTTWVDTERTTLAAGFAWENVAAVSGCAYWTIVGKGANLTGNTAEGVLEIRDFESKTVMRLVKGEHKLVYASISEMTGGNIDSAGRITFDILSDTQPIAEFSTALELDSFVEESSENNPANFEWEKIEGGKYRIVVESEAGVQTELNLVRKHVMNTAGSIFIMVIIALAVVGLFTGLIYRNKSKTDD